MLLVAILVIKGRKNYDLPYVRAKPSGSIERLKDRRNSMARRIQNSAYEW